jgi:S-adenosylmethionine-diacylglycerol 3-amino-3-carboxypropyl transferase
MPTTLPRWVIEAERQQLAFAQVREDAWLDGIVLERLGENVRVIQVASGGCTAAALAASSRVAHLHLVDPNPAQLALARLKLRLLQSASVPQRLALLGHAPMSFEERRVLLAENLTALGLAAHALGFDGLVERIGPDHAGRYELVFAQLRAALAPVGAELAAVLRLRDPVEQARRVAPATPLGRALDEAFDEVMALPNLVRLFSEQATRNAVEPFARHFARRGRHVLATLPAADNPYLWQMLAGRFPEGVVYPWLTLLPPPRMPEITWSRSGMTEALQERPNAFDFVHLSNILDWLSPEEARATLDHTAAALRPGGWTLIRQLNSTLDIPVLGPQFDWDIQTAADWHARDRSFFYRALHLGRKQ